MQASRVTRALLQQPGVRCLLGAATEALPSSVEPSASFFSSVARTAGVASPSGLSPIAGSRSTRSAFASSSAKAPRGGAPKDRRKGADAAKEEDPGLIRAVLRQDVQGLGRQGDVVAVKRGRMRHELYPSGLAAYATPDNVAKFALTDAQKRLRDSEQGAQEGVLEKLLRALARKSVVLTRRASLRDPDTFVGPPVSPDGIRTAVLRQLGIQLDPTHLLAEAEIKTYGTFKVPLNLRLPQPDDQQIELTVHVDRRGKDAKLVAGGARAGAGAGAAGSSPAAAAAAAGRST